MADFFKDEDEGYLEESYEAPPYPLPLRILGKVLKFSFFGVILLINVLVLWRIFSSSDPSDMQVIVGNEALADAYARAEQSGALDGFALYQPDHNDITDEKATHDENHNVIDPGNYGYFGVTNSLIFPTAHQAQIVFRYNDSTLEHLAKDYALPAVPEKGGEYYDVTLRVLTDLTPDDKTDNDKAEFLQTTRIKATSAKPAEKTLYTYRRMVFDALPDIEGIVAIYVDIYYVDDVNYNDEAYGTLCIWHEDARTKTYELTRDDIAAIKEY
jgi:hypothetical protein